jgi:hypothetical protein
LYGVVVGAFPAHPASDRSENARGSGCTTMSPGSPSRWRGPHPGSGRRGRRRPPCVRRRRGRTVLQRDHDGTVGGPACAFSYPRSSHRATHTIVTALAPASLSAIATDCEFRPGHPRVVDDQHMTARCRSGIAGAEPSWAVICWASSTTDADCRACSERTTSAVQQRFGSR